MIIIVKQHCQALPSFPLNSLNLRNTAVVHRPTNARPAINPNIDILPSQRQTCRYFSIKSRFSPFSCPCCLLLIPATSLLSPFSHPSSSPSSSPSSTTNLCFSLPSSFAIHRIRSRYLHSVRDGVGDRLIQLNPLTAPGFRSAGWGNPANIPRSHSPPIGTSNEYFSAAQRGRFAQLQEEQQATETNGNAGLALDGFGGIGLGAGLGGVLKTEGKDEEETEFAPGRVPLNDKIGMPLRPPTREEDISSDSDSEPEPEEE